jgi:glycosyltransferase involved in cell wall biosynthesis
MHDDMVRMSRDNPRVFYLNNVSGEQRNMLLSASDLFIMPNRTVEGDMEGFGLVAIEAASRGLPVIATAIEGITDAVIDGQNGYCLAEQDTKGFLDTITGLMNDPHRLRELSNRAAEFTCSNFSQERVFGRYEQIFDSLLDADGNSK